MARLYSVGGQLGRGLAEAGARVVMARVCYGPAVARDMAEKLRQPRVALVAWALACVPRLWFALAAHPPAEHIVSDMWVYHHRAENLLSGQLGAWDTFTPVGYPALLAALLHLTDHNYGLIAAIQAVLGAASAALTHRVGCRLSRGPWVPTLGAVAVCLHLPLVLYAGFLLTEVLATSLVLALVWLLLRAHEQPRAGRWLAAGLALGVATTVRPNLLSAYPLLLPWLWLAAGRSWRPGRTAIALVLAAAALPICAASIHNSRLLERPTGLGTNGGLNFYLNFSDVRVVHHRDHSGRHTIAPIPNVTYFEREVTTSQPFYAQGHFYSLGLAALADDPGLLWRARRNLVNGAGMGPLSYWPGWRGHLKLLRNYSRGFFYAALVPALGLLVMLALRRQLWQPGRLVELLLAALILSAALVLYFFLGDPRIRVPFDPLLILLALSTYASAAHTLWTWRTGQTDSTDSAGAS